MKQKYILNGILVIGLLIWVSAALSVTGIMGITPKSNSNNVSHREMHDTDHHNENSGHHGMMDGDDECDEYETHEIEGYDCESNDNKDYCHQMTHHMEEVK